MRLTVTRAVAVLGTAGLAFAGLAPLVAQAAPASKGKNGKSSVVAYSNVAGRGGNGHGGEHSGGSHGSPGGSGGSGGNSGNPGTAGPPRGNGQGANGNNGNHHGCHYPPSRSPQVTLTGPARPRAGSTVDLIGVVSTNGCPHDRFRVGLYSSHDGTTQWRLINSRTIHSDGRYRFKVTVHRLHYYQVVLAADGGRAVATSPIVRVATR